MPAELIDTLNDEEQNVWTTVENYTKQLMTGKLDKFLKNFHKKYSGWNYAIEEPINKENIQTELQHLPKIKIISYTLRPAAIQIINNVAIVHYYYSAEFEDSVGLINFKNNRYTDILLKEKDSWVLISDYIGKETLGNSIENKNK